MSLTPRPRERVIAQIQHRETDVLPYDLGFEGDVAEQLDAYYGTVTWRTRLDNAIRHVPGAELGIPDDALPFSTDRFGTVWRVDKRPAHLVEAPLKQASLAGFEFPDVDSCLAPDWAEQARLALVKHAGYFTVSGIGFGLFERTWTLRGFNEMLMDSAAEPAFYDELVERIAQHQMALVERLLTLPVDGIMFSDDWGYQQGVLLGPERWRQFIKPRLERMYAQVHGAGKYTLSHCCGSVVDILPDLIEIGLDVLQSVQPEARGMNPYELKRRFGDRITFWGGLGSQSTIPFGTPAEIKSEVRRLCREMGRGGGYILGPAKSLQPETRLENAAAVVEAFLEQNAVQRSG
jgi:uroporphyrinogen decarboxylase